MTPSEVIAEARRIIQDTLAPTRYSDTVMLGFVNQILKRTAMLRPDLFSAIADIPTSPNVVAQSCPADSIRLVEIFQVKNGGAVVEANRRTLDQTSPTWVSATPGAPVNYMRHVRNPNRYFLYPPPTAGVVLVGEYVRSPPDYVIDQEITYPSDAYFPAVVDGVVFLAESTDDEHVNAGRAKMFQDSFTQLLGVGLQARSVTDFEDGGQDPKKVM